MHARVTLLAAVLFARASSGADAQFAVHPVRSVIDGERIVVVYAGLPVTVRLAQVRLADRGDLKERARHTIEGLVKGKLVRAAYCPEAGLDEHGLPQVFVSAGTNLVNAELVRQGLARYEPGNTPSQFYRAKMTAADTTARSAKAGVWSADEAIATAPQVAPAAREPIDVTAESAPVELGVVYSELNSSQFHLPTCRWAIQMSPQRRIRYKTAELAERAGKRPCWICMSEQAKHAVFTDAAHSDQVRVLEGKGPLVACDGVLHACNCEEILTKGASCRSVATWTAAQADGLKPCLRCLRLAGGDVPLPEKGECIGRAPPQRRPCRRAPADESGLCLHCQGKE